MSLDKPKITKLSNRFRMFTPKKERNTMKKPFVERSQEQEGVENFRRNGQNEEQKKVSQDKRSTLEVEIHRSPDHDEDPVEH